MVAWDEIHEREIALLTNMIAFASTIAAIYKDRWDRAVFQGVEVESEGQELRGRSFLRISVLSNSAAIPTVGWGRFLGRCRAALRENGLDSISERIEPEEWNAEEALRDDQQLFAEDAKLHLLSQERR